MKRYSHAILCLAVLTLGFTVCPLSAEPVKAKASAIQVEMIRSDEIKLPAEFQISLYENLVRQLEKQGGFEHVYRDENGALHGVIFALPTAGAEPIKKELLAQGAHTTVVEERAAATNSSSKEPKQ